MSATSSTTTALPAPQAGTPATVLDTGALRLGGLSPLFAPASVADAGTLRMGGLSPLFARG